MSPDDKKPHITRIFVFSRLILFRDIDHDVLLIIQATKNGNVTQRLCVIMPYALASVT